MASYTQFGRTNGQIFRFEIESGLYDEQRFDEQAHGTYCDPCPDFFSPRGCPRITRCPWRHVKPRHAKSSGYGEDPDNVGLRSCKHYLRGLCKKNELTCDYLHTTDPDKMVCFSFHRAII